MLGYEQNTMHVGLLLSQALSGGDASPKGQLAGVTRVAAPVVFSRAHTKDSKLYLSQHPNLLRE